MMIQNYTYEFQFWDIVYHACKDSLVNGNHMGLGKTREMLMFSLLRGFEKNLIICPSKLIGEWQDEIHNVILPFVRRVRRNWMGKFMTAECKVIEYASDLEDLATFNIISFDKLKSTPRDGRFYKCPECGTVAYSYLQQPFLSCPGNPLHHESMRCSHVKQAWKEEAKRKKLRKYAIDKETREPIPWKEVDKRDPDSYEFIDERINELGDCPRVPRMFPLENMYVKQKYYVKSWQEDEDGVRHPVIGQRDRKPHVAWTFAGIMRNMFPNIIVDEALYIANQDSLRSQAVYNMTAKSKRPLTGTPMKGMPQGVLPIWNWTFDKHVLPHYRPYDPEGQAKFLRKYKTEVLVDCVVDDNGNVAGGRWKQVPKINNPELFQVEFSPLMRRHTRNEPAVIKDIPKKEIVYDDRKIEMHPEHKKYYNLWLEEFAEWWQEMKEDEEKRKANRGALLTKIAYLINASTIPHHMYDNILKNKKNDEASMDSKRWAKRIGKYKGPLPAKLLTAFSIVKESVEAGDKCLVASTRKANLAIGKMWAQKSGLRSMIIDGTVSLKIQKNSNRSPRHMMVQQFRNEGYHVMWAGLEALAEGMNIPEANHGIIIDAHWRPDKPRQFMGRMIRPQQKKTIYEHFLMHLGTIDDYIAAVCYLKGRSADEGMDYMEFDDFSVEQIPDFSQYADAIVDGTEAIMKSKMWLAVEHLRKQQERGNEE